MRFPVATFLLPLLLLLPAAAADAALAVVRVQLGWRDTESFQRISEFFTGRESTGRELVARTQPASRDGFYFLVRVKNSTQAALPAKARLEVIAPDAPDSRTHEFSLALPRGEKVVHLGLTGSDWPDPEAHPVAWKLTWLDAAGTVLAERQSFLWSLPPKG